MTTKVCCILAPSSPSQFTKLRRRRQHPMGARHLSAGLRRPPARRRHCCRPPRCQSILRRSRPRGCGRGCGRRRLGVARGVTSLQRQGGTAAAQPSAQPSGGQQGKAVTTFLTIQNTILSTHLGERMAARRQLRNCWQVGNWRACQGSPAPARAT